MKNKKLYDFLTGAITLVLTIIFVIVIMGLHMYSERGSVMSWLP
ncbi:Uncharacterised protein [Enterobacter hormaechei]|nr:Uncharacterised protein [Enterobacter hormaechei]